MLKSINKLTILDLPYLQMKYKLRTEKSNITTMMEFILLGFSDIPNSQWSLLGIFLILYLTILMCNSVIVLITRIDPTLQTPMCFFPESLFRFRNLLRNCHYPKNANRPPEPYRACFFHGLCYTNVFGPSVRRFRVSPPGCDGL